MSPASIECNESRPHSDLTGDMIWIPGGTFRMGSDHHYPEQSPSHRVCVDGFWIDRTPVTNRQFKTFVKVIGHVTTAQIVSGCGIFLDRARHPAGEQHGLGRGEAGG